VGKFNRHGHFGLKKPKKGSDPEKSSRTIAKSEKKKNPPRLERERRLGGFWKMNLS